MLAAQPRAHVAVLAPRGHAGIHVLLAQAREAARPNFVGRAPERVRVEELVIQHQARHGPQLALRPTLRRAGSKPHQRAIVRADEVDLRSDGRQRAQQHRHAHDDRAAALDVVEGAGHTGAAPHVASLGERELRRVALGHRSPPALTVGQFEREVRARDTEANAVALARDEQAVVGALTRRGGRAGAEREQGERCGPQT